MQENENFFTRMDRALATEKESKELAGAETKADAKVKELGEPRQVEIKRQAGVVEMRSSPGPAPVLPPPLSPPSPPREVNPVDEIEFKAIPADPMTVAETLVKVRTVIYWSLKSFCGGHNMVCECKWDGRLW